MAKRIEVDMHEWKQARRGVRLLTRDIDACIAVGLSDPVNDLGYLGHFSPDSTNLEEMIEAAKRRVSHPQYIKLWYGGAAFVPPRTLDSGELNRETRAFRIRTSRILLRQDFDVRGQHWLKPGRWLAMQLLAGTDQCIFRETPGRY